MAVKVARESFSKEEIIDILKRNVALYKNERDFVDYIVNLAMFLIDQQHDAHVKDPEGPAIQQDYNSLDQDALSGLTPMPVTGFIPMAQSRAQTGGIYPQAPQGSGEHAVPQQVFYGNQGSGVYQKPPTPLPGVSGNTPVPGMPGRPQGVPIGTPVAGIPVSPSPLPGQAYASPSPMQTPLMPPSGSPPAMRPQQPSLAPPAAFSQAPAQADLEQNASQPFGPTGPRYSAGGSRFDVESSPLNSSASDVSSRFPSGQTPFPMQPGRPSPPAGPPRPPVSPQQLPQPGQRQPPPLDQGMNSRTKVYKVFRSYASNQSQASTTYCPICGTEASGQRKCPSCGHLI